MNEIKVRRMILGGVAAFVTWVVVEILVEQVVGGMLFPGLQSEWLKVTSVGTWEGVDHLVNLAVGVLSCTVLIWLYASLRPMYGVGTRAALITSVFGVVWTLTMFVNLINLGIFPARISLVEMAYVTIETPIAMIVGAGVYEGRQDQDQE